MTSAEFSAQSNEILTKAPAVTGSVEELQEEVVSLHQLRCLLNMPYNQYEQARQMTPAEMADYFPADFAEPEVKMDYLQAQFEKRAAEVQQEAGRWLKQGEVMPTEASLSKAEKAMLHEMRQLTSEEAGKLLEKPEATIYEKTNITRNVFLLMTMRQEAIHRMDVLLFNSYQDAEKELAVARAPFAALSEMDKELSADRHAHMYAPFEVTNPENGFEVMRAEHDQQQRELADSARLATPEAADAWLARTRSVQADVRKLVDESKKQGFEQGAVEYEKGFAQTLLSLFQEAAHAVKRAVYGGSKTTDADDDAQDLKAVKIAETQKERVLAKIETAFDRTLELFPELRHGRALNGEYLGALSSGAVVTLMTKQFVDSKIATIRKPERINDVVPVAVLPEGRKLNGRKVKKTDLKM